MNKITAFIIFLLVASIFGTLGYLSISADYEQRNDCKDLCSEKGLEYFKKINSNENGKPYCICLNNGVENKFALGGISE